MRKTIVMLVIVIAGLLIVDIIQDRLYNTAQDNFEEYTILCERKDSLRLDQIRILKEALKKCGDTLSLQPMEENINKKRI